MTHRILHDREISGLLAALSEQQDFVYFDTSMPDTMNHRSLLFTEPVDRLRLAVGEDRGAFLDKVAQRLDQGFYLAGWLGYELLHDELAINLDVRHRLLPYSAAMDGTAPSRSALYEY